MNWLLETERLRLRELTWADYDGLCLMLRDAETMYAYEHAFSEAEAREWLQKQLDRYAGYGFGLWAVALKETGALIEGRAICLGYTNTMLWLCEKAGLRCSAISGYASWNGEEHGWDMAYLEEGSYYMDITWCDQRGEPGSDGWNSCFMVTEAVLSEDHGIWTGGPATGTVDYR